MDVDPLGSDLLEVEDSADSEFMVRGLPQLSIPCAIITITSKHVLKKAAKKLGVSIHGFDFTSLGGDDITASEQMSKPAVVNRIGNPKGSSIGESQSIPPPTATKTPTSVEKGSHAASASRRVLSAAGAVLLPPNRSTSLSFYDVYSQTKQLKLVLCLLVTDWKTVHLLISSLLRTVYGNQDKQWHGYLQFSIP